MLEPPAIVRPATSADFPAIARLLIQLYAAEVPDALSGGSLDAQQRLLQCTLEAKQVQGLVGRFVRCEEDGVQGGRVIATGVVELPGVPRYERAPDGTIRLAPRTG